MYSWCSVGASACCSEPCPPLGAGGSASSSSSHRSSFKLLLFSFLPATKDDSNSSISKRRAQPNPAGAISGCRHFPRRNTSQSQRRLIAITNNPCLVLFSCIKRGRCAVEGKLLAVKTRDDRDSLAVSGLFSIEATVSATWIWH